MNKSSILPACLIMIILSCSDSGDPKPIYFNVEKVSGKYLVDKEEHIAFNAVWGDLQLNYNNKALVKRVGGCYGGYAYPWICVPEIYDTLILVNKNTLRISVRDAIEGLSIVPFEREIAFEKGLMKSKISAKNLASATEADTIFYFYNSSKQLERTEQRLHGVKIIRHYFFDDRGNLEKISGEKWILYTGTLADTTEETFGGYDDHPNPLKGMYIWSDLFYRSLSNNNFSTYHFTSKDGWEDRTWALAYNEKGEVDYSK